MDENIVDQPDWQKAKIGDVIPAGSLGQVAQESSDGIWRRDVWDFKVAYARPDSKPTNMLPNQTRQFNRLPSGEWLRTA